MDTKKAWEQYHSPGQSPVEDDVLLTMIQEMVDTIHNLERMYGNHRAQLMVRSMLLDYNTLQSWAWHRHLDNIPEL